MTEQPDLGKSWSLAALPIGALLGGWLGRLCGNVVIGRYCASAASNLCGLFAAPALPFYVAVGAVMGAAIAGLSTVVIVTRRKA